MNQKKSIGCCENCQDDNLPLHILPTLPGEAISYEICDACLEVGWARASGCASVIEANEATARTVRAMRYAGLITTKESDLINRWLIEGVESDAFGDYHPLKKP